MTLIQKLLGPERGQEPAPTNSAGTKFVVRISAYSGTNGQNDLERALEVAWDGYRLTEGLSEVWDYRGDTGEYDEDAEPALIAIVGCVWSEED